MKVKTPSKAENPMTRISTDLFKLHFCGGEQKNSPRGKRLYSFGTRKRSPLVGVTHTTGKGKNKVEVNSVMRLSSGPECEIKVTLTLKDMSLAWDYEDHTSDKFAKGSSGMHSKLVKIFGRHPNE